MAEIERYAAPESLGEALELIAGGPATLLAGGTDLMPQTRSGQTAFAPLLVNLGRILELKGIRATGEAIRLGALTTVTEILDSDLLPARARVLAETADRFASGQIRNVATVGGNLCNASPAGDLIIPLLLLDAEVELAAWADGGPTGRTVPLEAFFVGPGQTRRRPGEILTAVRFPVPPEGFVARFRKFGTRPALDISVVSVGVGGQAVNGALTNVRVALGAVAPVPLRARRAEAVLEGRVLDPKTIAEAARTAAAEISPISDVRASAWYRRELVRTLTARLLEDVRQAGD